MASNNIRIIATNRLAYTADHGPHAVYVEAMRRRTSLLESMVGRKWLAKHTTEDNTLLTIIRGYYAMRAAA